VAVVRKTLGWYDPAYTLILLGTNDWHTCKSLPPSQCYTIEPRLPIEGHGIATCEEIVAVTEGGCVFLSRPQEELFLVR